MRETSAEKRKKLQRLYFSRESKKPIPSYPFPSMMDKQTLIPFRIKKYEDFCKWEIANLKKLEFFIKLAKKLVISKTEAGPACMATPEGRVNLSSLLLENLDKNIINSLLEKEADEEITEEVVLKTVWEAVKKHVLAKKEELRIYSQS